MEKTNPIGRILRLASEKNLSPRSRELLEESLQKVKAQQAENARQAITEIRELSDSIEYGELLGRYAPLTDEDAKISDIQRASGVVAYAALYPTFGDRGIELVVNEWKTAARRRNQLPS